MDKTVLISLPIEDLQTVIIDCVTSCLKYHPKGINKNLDKSQDLLTRDDTCKLLQIDSSTLWAWTNKGKVKAYGIGNRRYYKRSELMAALTPVNK